MIIAKRVDSLTITEWVMASENQPGRKQSARKHRATGRPVSTGKRGKERISLATVVSGDVYPDFLSLAENSPNMIFINHRGRVVYANRLCEEIMGYTKSEFYSAAFDFRSLISPESLPTIEKRFAGHMRGEDQAPYEYKLVTKDRKKLDVVIATKLVDYDGDRAILGIVTDISHYKKMEKDVQKERDRQKEYLDVAGVVMVAIDLRGNVTMVNNKGCEILGLPEE